MPHPEPAGSVPRPPDATVSLGLGCGTPTSASSPPPEPAGKFGAGSCGNVFSQCWAPADEPCWAQQTGELPRREGWELLAAQRKGALFWDSGSCLGWALLCHAATFDILPQQPFSPRLPVWGGFVHIYNNSISEIFLSFQLYSRG